MDLHLPVFVYVAPPHFSSSFLIPYNFSLQTDQSFNLVTYQSDSSRFSNLLQASEILKSHKILPSPAPLRESWPVKTVRRAMHKPKPDKQKVKVTDALALEEEMTGMTRDKTEKKRKCCNCKTAVTTTSIDLFRDPSETFVKKIAGEKEVYNFPDGADYQISHSERINKKGRHAQICMVSL